MLVSLIGTMAELWLWVTVVSLALLTVLVTGQAVTRKTVALVHRLRPTEPVRVPVRAPQLVR